MDNVSGGTYLIRNIIIDFLEIREFVENCCITHNLFVLFVIVSCRAVTKQRPRDKQIYKNRL
jgi:hypothetical protein